MEMNKATVIINGNEYTMKGEESKEEMYAIASYVDKKIKEVNMLNNKLNPVYASVLAALNITNELFKLRKEVDYIKNTTRDPIRQLEELRVKYDKLVEENKMLLDEAGENRKELERLNKELNDNKRGYESLKEDYANKSEELVKSYREYELMRREKENKQKELERVKIELSESKHKLIDLQNQLLQSQIEMVKIKKEFDEYKLSSATEVK